MLHHTITPKLEQQLAEVRSWDIGGFTATPFLLQYGVSALGSRLAEHDPEIAFPFYIVWYSHSGSTALACFDKDRLLEKAKWLLGQYELFAAKFTEWQGYRDAFYSDLGDGSDLNNTRYEAFEAAYYAEYSHAFYPEYLLYADELLAPLIAKYGAELVQQAAAPDEQTFITRLKECELQVALGERDLQELVASFSWVRNNYRDTDVFDLPTAEQEIAQLKSGHAPEELRRMLAELRKVPDKEMLRNTVEPSDWEVLKLFSLSALWLDQRKEANLRANSYINAYLRKKAEELGVPLIDLQFLFPEELRQVLAGTSQLEHFPIAERQEGCVEIASAEEGDFLITGKDMEPLLRFHPDKLHASEEAQEVRGQVASRGKARGRVRIVLDPSAIRDFEQGSILVAYMTRPDYVPFMKKAAAIVTNEGGITSHAAIISRELGIPCVIGTKHATKLFKDGDLVEVDAERGAVHVINSDQ